MTKICVPIMGKNINEIISDTTKAVAAGTDIIEWRADYYEDICNADVKSILNTIRSIADKIQIIFTIRTADEGGQIHIHSNEYERLCKDAACSGRADYIDVEIYSMENISSELIKNLKQHKVKVIGSYHNFTSTPDCEKMYQLLYGIKEAGADYCKIAVMPCNIKDTWNLMNTSRRFKDENNANVITMAMGDIGMLSRVACKYTGSYITFASVGKASAPGQLEVGKIKKILQLAELKPDKNIVMIGFMGTGKTTVSDALNAITGLEEIDTDLYIEDKCKMKIADIFSRYGEEYFRTCETQAIQEIMHKKNAIVSCGGGAVLRNENVQMIKQYGKLVLLTATPETIYERVRHSNSRPLLNNDMSIENISRLMEGRKERYNEVADIVVSTDNKNVVEICLEILEQML
ncbi:MAG: type I 3-dehydroquinate dehydratase [Eubacterium sp.]